MAISNSGLTQSLLDAQSACKEEYNTTTPVKVQDVTVAKTDAQMT